MNKMNKLNKMNKKKDENKLYAEVFQLVVRFQNIIELKCNKYNIKLKSADTSMVYLELLCQMIKNEPETESFLHLVNKTNNYFIKLQEKTFDENPIVNARVLRKSVSSVDEENTQFDILTLHELEVQRWKIAVKLLNRV